MSDTIIDLKNVNVFHKKNLLLNNVNLNVQRGEFVYLIGKTGTGKKRKFEQTNGKSKKMTKS